MASQGEIRVLLGKESPVGTTASTFKVWRGTAELHEIDEVKFAEETIGLISKNTRDAIVTTKSEGMIATDQASYEQIVYPLNMVLEGIVPTGGGPTYTWTYDPTLNNVADPTTFTVRYGIDGKYYQSDYVLGTDLTISFAAEEPWKISAKMAGGTVTTSGYVSVETLSAQTAILAGQTSVYIDNSWATLGNTVVSGYLIDAQWVLPGYHQKSFVDGSLEPTSHGLAKRAAKLEMTVEWDTAQDATERTAWRNGTKRFIELKAVNGSQSVTIDGCYIITDMATIGNRNGNITVKYTLESFYDTTASKEYKVVVINTTSAL